MRAVVAKLFPTLAGIVLVVPFLVVALLVGHYALAGAGRGANTLLFGALALCGVAYSAVAGRPAGMQLAWPVFARRTRP
ncbi:MAG TPA: hypothetical protein VF546_17340 [Pyrinomonadaceae bacterium]|jgi:hypothetical protein